MTSVPSVLRRSRASSIYELFTVLCFFKFFISSHFRSTALRSSILFLLSCLLPPLICIYFIRTPCGYAPRCCPIVLCKVAGLTGSLNTNVHTYTRNLAPEKESSGFQGAYPLRNVSITLIYLSIRNIYIYMCIYNINFSTKTEKKTFRRGAVLRDSGTRLFLSKN